MYRTQRRDDVCDYARQAVYQCYQDHEDKLDCKGRKMLDDLNDDLSIRFGGFIQAVRRKGRRVAEKTLAPYCVSLNIPQNGCRVFEVLTLYEIEN